MADTIHDQIEAERKAALPEASKLVDFRDYARGRHYQTLTNGQRKILQGLLGQLFCDNVCGQVLQTLTNRLRLVRFEVAGDEESAALVLAYLEDLWIKNKLGALSGAVHWATLRDGNTAVAVSWYNDRVALTRENFWNGTQGIFVAYDDFGGVTYAVKEWKSSIGTRRTVWFPDRIERYLADGNGWKPFRLDSDQGKWPVPWLAADGSPLGVPVVHFANLQVPNDGRGQGEAGSPHEPDSMYGMSELDGGILGLQDEINDMHRDISAAARFTGYQMLYATGVQTELDEETGEPVPLRVEPGAVYQDENPNAKFGTLPAGEIAPLVEALTVKLQAVSRATGVPMHEITGQWPSGEALLRVEMPLIDKVETIGASVGPAWGSVAHKAVKLANTFGGRNLDETALITAIFNPVAKRDPLIVADIADRRARYVSRREVLRLLGYSPQDIQRIFDEISQERALLNPREALEIERARLGLEGDREAATVAGGAGGDADNPLADRFREALNNGRLQ